MDASDNISTNTEWKSPTRFFQASAIRQLSSDTLIITFDDAECVGRVIGVSVSTWKWNGKMRHNKCNK